MAYTTETKVYDRTGMSTANIQELSGKSASDVTTLVSGYIADAQIKIRDEIGYPIVITEELHLGDGNKNKFKLGPQDEDIFTFGDYDPTDNLIQVYNLWFGSKAGKKWRPWPEDCDEWTEYTAPGSSGWSNLNATLTGETTIKKAGTYSVKAVFSAAGYVQYPDGSTVDYFDRNIDLYPDFFLHFRTDNKDITFTIRLYDMDGNYKEETISPRQDNVGQYFWLDLSIFDDGLGTINWNDDRFQYWRLYASGACTVYIDNACFADSWAFTAAEGLIHISVSDNVSAESPPSEGYPLYATYGYDPYLASTPANIAEATEWLAGISIIDYLRGIRYRQTSFEVFGETLELDTDASREGLLGIRTKMLKRYNECMRSTGGSSWGVIW